MLPEIPGGISSYALFTALAMAAGILFIYFRLDEVGLTFKELALYCMTGAIFCVLSAKLVYAVSYLPTAGFSPENFFHYFIHGGIVFYGGLLGFILGIVIMARIQHRNCIYLLDEIAPAVPRFHAIARFGCLLGGCCYGIPWHWGVTMVESPDVIRFPVQIAESICNILIFSVLLMRAKREKSFSGSFIIYMFSYASCRFLLEFLRGDMDRGIWFLGLSTSQIIALLILFVIGLKWMVVHRSTQI